MKKLLLVLLFGTMAVLSACDKQIKADHDQAAVTQIYSQNNLEDIQQDLVILQKYSDLRAEQSIEIQNRFSSILANQQSGGQALQEIQSFFLESNKGLDALKIKSTEVEQRRQMLKQINILTIQLTQEAIEQHPDQKKMEDIQVKLQDLKQQLIKNHFELEKKLSETKT